MCSSDLSTPPYTSPGANRLARVLHCNGPLRFTFAPMFLPYNSSLIEMLPTCSCSMEDPHVFYLTIECKAMSRFFERLDASNKEAVFTKHKEWFNRSLDKSAVDKMYNPIVKLKSNRPTMRFRVLMEGDNATIVWKAEIDKDDNLIYREGKYSDIQRGCKIMLSAETRGLWFTSQSFGMSFVAKDLLVFAPPAAARRPLA